MLLSVKFFMHKNFLNQKQQEGTLSGIKSYIDQIREKEAIEENDYKFLSFIITKIEDKVRG